MPSRHKKVSLKVDDANTSLVRPSDFNAPHDMPWIDIKDYGRQEVTDAAITSADATLTSATAAFVAADVGKTVTVTGADTGGTDLVTTILSRTNGTTVELSRNAGATVSAARMVWGGAQGDAKSVADGAITTGTAALTSATAAFTRGDIGKGISVHNAGAAVAAPGVASIALAAGTSLGIGLYRYKITFVSDRGGETEGGTTFSITTTGGNQIISLTNIPAGTSDTNARRIYRTQVGGADGTQRLVATMLGNQVVGYTDQRTDAVIAGATAVPTVTSFWQQLFTTISAYTSATAVTLAANASHTMTGAIIRYGTNDTVAIQAAVDALDALGGGELLVPLGKFIVTTITGKSNIIYGGQGKGSQIWMKENQAAFTRMLSFTAKNNITIRDLYFDGNKANQPLDADMYATQQNHIIFVNGTGGGCSDIRVMDCDFINASGDAIYLYGPDIANRNLQGFIARNHCLYIRRAAISLGGVESMLVLENYIDGLCPIFNTNGIHTEADNDTMPAWDVNIVGNIIKNCSQAISMGGWYTALENFERMSVVSNICENNGSADTILGAIEINNMSNVTVVGNIVRGTTMVPAGSLHGGGFGIMMRSTNSVVSNNMVTDCDGVGIFIGPVGGAPNLTNIICQSNNVLRWDLELVSSIGIQTYLTDHSLVSNNVVYDGGATSCFGIVLMDTTYTICAGNRISSPTNRDSGIGLWERSVGAGSNNNTITGNIVNNFNTYYLTSGANSQMWGNNNTATDVFEAWAGGTKRFSVSSAGVIGVGSAIDFTAIAAPANPASGVKRLFIDTTDTLYKSLDSSGNTAIMDNLIPAKLMNEFDDFIASDTDHWVVSLGADHAISSTTGTVVALGVNGLLPGNYAFKFSLLVQSATTTVGPMLGVNFTGTATISMVFSFADATTVITAAVHAMDNVGILGAGFIDGMAHNAFSTTAPNMGTTIGVSNTGVNIPCFIEGVLTVTAVGNLDLWHSSETNTSTTVKAGSILVVDRA